MHSQDILLKKKIVRFGYPHQIVCDNGQPFSSEEFSLFCKSNGINLNHTVPYAPFQNGLVERQNRTLLKTIRISVSMGRDWKTDLLDYLHAYRSTPHAVTNYTPSELMFGWNIRDRIPGTTRNVDIEKAIDNDKQAKEKGRKYADTKRRATSCNIDVGDLVLVKNVIRKNKLTPTFNTQEHEVIKREGTRLHLKNLETGVLSNRHVNHAKKTACRNPLKTQGSISEDKSNFGIPYLDSFQNNNNGTYIHNNVFIFTDEERIEDALSVTPKRVNEESFPENRRQKRRPAYLADYQLNQIELINNK